MQTETTKTNGTKKDAAQGADMAGVNVHAIPTSRIVESKTNPRRRFEGIDELAASIKEHGQLTPGTAREIGGKVELVFGARRFRAITKAGVSYMLLTIREMSDAQVQEAQLVENLQRKDVHPLEEADAIEELRRKFKYTDEVIAAKLSRDVAEIKKRSKLAALGPKVRQAFFDGVLDTPRAFILARIPHHDLQATALEDLRRITGRVPELEDFRRIVLQRYVLRLDDAGFNRKSLTLVPAAGACDACPKRTGNQRALFEDVKEGDLCTDAKCFRAKRDAHYVQVVEEAKKAGLTVLSDKEAKASFTDGGYLSDAGKAYEDLDRVNYQDGKARTWRELLRKKLPPITIARDHEGKVHELVRTVDARAAARELGYPWAREGKKAKPNLDAKKDREKKNRKARIIRALLGAVADKGEELKDFSPAVLRVIVEGAIRLTYQAALEEVIKRRELQAPGKKTEGVAQSVVLKAAKSMKPGELRGLLLELVCMHGNAFEIGPTLRDTAAALKIDVAKVAKGSALAEEEPKK